MGGGGREIEELAMAVRERKGANWFVRLSGEWGRFQGKQVAVEGWQGGGEYFGGKIGPWGGRKRLDRRWRQGARRERGRRARRESRGAKKMQIAKLANY